MGRSEAFTLLELLVVIAMVAIVAGMMFPVLGRTKARARVVACISNLKQIGFSSISFEAENGKLPAATMPNTNRFLSPLQAVLHEAGSPKLFLCPADKERASNWNPAAALDRTNTSYFVSYDALVDQPQSILAGDRNITCRVPGEMVFARITGAMRCSRDWSFGWWRDIHNSKGNLLLSDGSVGNRTPRQFNSQISAQPDLFFRWYIPNGDMISTPME